MNWLQWLIVVGIFAVLALMILHFLFKKKIIRLFWLNLAGGVLVGMLAVSFLYGWFQAFGLNWLHWTALVYLIVFLFLCGFVIVPSNYSAVVRFFERRLYVIGEGPGFVAAFCDAKAFSHQLRTTAIDQDFLSSNSESGGTLGVTITGPLQWRPSRNGELLKNVFFGLSEDSIHEGLKSTVQSEIGKIVGLHEAREFISNRDAIEIMINAVFRLKDPFKGVPMEKRLAWIKDNALDLREQLNQETKKPSTTSRVEDMYGIEIVKFDLADVSFDEKTTAALEEKQQNKAKAEAAEPFFKLGRRFREEFPHLDDQARLNATQVELLPKVEKKIVSVEGLRGLFSSGFDRIGIGPSGSGSGLASTLLAAPEATTAVQESSSKKVEPAPVTAKAVVTVEASTTGGTEVQNKAPAVTVTTLPASASKQTASVKKAEVTAKKVNDQKPRAQENSKQTKVSVPAKPNKPADPHKDQPKSEPGQPFHHPLAPSPISQAKE